MDKITREDIVKVFEPIEAKKEAIQKEIDFLSKQKEILSKQYRSITDKIDLLSYQLNALNRQVDVDVIMKKTHKIKRRIIKFYGNISIKKLTWTRGFEVIIHPYSWSNVPLMIKRYTKSRNEWRVTTVNCITGKSSIKRYKDPGEMAENYNRTIRHLRGTWRALMKLLIKNDGEIRSRCS